MGKSPHPSAISECRQACANQDCRRCKQCRRFHDNDLCVFEHLDTTREQITRLEQETIGGVKEVVHKDQVLCAQEIDKWISSLSRHLREENCAGRCRCRRDMPMKYCVNGTDKLISSRSHDLCDSRQCAGRCRCRRGVRCNNSHDDEDRRKGIY
jgi:hypothetical protein